MDSVVEDIKSRINIIDFIGQYLRLTKAGANWKARCPFHNEKTPSFMVHEEKQIWHCFGCQKGGDVFGFLMEMEGVEFKEALKILAEKAGVELKQYRYEKEQTTDKNKILEILELAAKFYETQLWKGMGKEKILRYLRERGINDSSIKEFRLGYAPPGWRNLLSFLIGRNYKIEDIAKTGLLVEKVTNDQRLTTNDDVVGSKSSVVSQKYYDRFRDRITFPVSDIMGKIVGFSARVAPGGDESQAKYVNTPETIVYHKSKILYGIDKAKQEIKNKNFVLLVEGNTDVIAASQAGLENTVAVSGTALTAEQLEILKRYTENLKLFFDMDAAGEEATKKSATLAFHRDFNVFVVQVQGGKDAAEIAKNNLGGLLPAIESSAPAMEYFLRFFLAKYDKNKAAEKKIIAREMLALIAAMASEVERSHWIKKLAEVLEVEERALTDLLKRFLAERGRDVYREKEAVAEDIISQKRSGIIIEKITGLMLADSSVWKKINNLDQDEILDFLKKNELLKVILEKGPEADFKYENIMISLENEEIRKKVSHLYFKTRYQFQSQENMEEVSPEDNLKLVQNYLDQVKREVYREKLETIAKDIAKAEKDDDKNSLSFLMKEFSRISKELT